MYAYLALAAIQLVGGYQQGDIIRQQGDLQNNIARMNSKFAELDAHNALEAGYSNAARYQDQVDVTQGAVRGGYASENVSIGYGTAGEVEKDNRVAGLANTLQIQRNAQNAAAGYQYQALNLRLGGQMTQLQAGLNASSSEGSGTINAISTAVAGYAYGQTTGKGNSSRTGTDSKPIWDKSANVSVNDSGDGIRAPANYGTHDLGWWSRGTGDNSGFYGHGDQVPGWRDMAAPGNAYYDYGRGRSFTDEVG